MVRVSYGEYISSPLNRVFFINVAIFWVHCEEGIDVDKHTHTHTKREKKIEKSKVDLELEH